MMADSDLNVPRKRRRPAKSCEQCRRRKIRCDQSLPCAACIRARASLECSYRSDSLGPANVTVEAPSVLTPESRSESVHVQHTAARANAPQENTIGELRSRIHQLEAQLTSLRQGTQLPTPSGTTGPQTTQSQPRDSVSGESSQTSPPDICIPATTPRLRNASDKTKLFAQSHWLHTAEKFQVIGKFDATEVEPAFNAAQTELAGLTKETRSLRHKVITQHSVRLTSPVPDLLGTLPSRAVCDELARSYFRTFEPIYRIVHVPTFWRDYNQFWERGTSTATPISFLMKLVVVLAIGTTFSPESADISRSGLLRSAQTWIYAAQWWLAGPSEKSTATLDGLQVFCLLLLARKATHNCPGSSTWLSTGSLMTMAQTMGLHRNPRMFTSLNPFQVEMRARLWTTVLELTCLSSLDSALPPNISADDFENNLPSNHDDEDLDPAGTAEILPREGVTDSSIQILLAKSLPLRLRAVNLLSSFRSEQSYQRALKLGAELRTVCREVASFLYSALPRCSSQDGSGLTLTDFHRKFMDIYLRKYILLLHRPFMLQARKDARFYLARKVCVESAAVIGSYCSGIEAASETLPVDDLSRLSMVGRGSFKCALSLDVIMVLAMEVITQLEEEGPYQSVPDPLDEINKAGRAPLIRTLEQISAHSLRAIESGTPSLKRYMFLSAYLSQIGAMESGQSVKQVVYEAMLEAMRKCKSLLHTQARGAASGGGEPVASAAATSASVYQSEMDPIDTDAQWDIPYIFDWPLLGEEEGQNSWMV